MYAKITNGSVDQLPYTVGQLRRDNPNTSFPKRVTDEMLAGYGVVPVTYTDAPTYDERTQKAAQDSAPTLVNGAWTIGWQVTNKTAEELAQQEADKAAQVRADRNTRVAASDWTQGKDIPDNVSSQWAAYRQALRDVPAQAGFPWDVQWPPVPGN